MPQSHAGSNRDQVVDTMIGLTRLSNLHRAIVSGGDSLELSRFADAVSFAWRRP